LKKIKSAQFERWFGQFFFLKKSRSENKIKASLFLIQKCQVSRLFIPSAVAKKIWRVS